MWGLMWAMTRVVASTSQMVVDYIRLETEHVRSAAMDAIAAASANPTILCESAFDCNSIYEDRQSVANILDRGMMNRTRRTVGCLPRPVHYVRIRA